jgi:hypothetical protein
MALSLPVHLRGIVSAACVAVSLLTSCGPVNNTTIVDNTEAFRREKEREISQEIRTGTCSETHRRVLQGAIEKVTESFTARSEYAGFKAVGTQYVVAKETGVSIALDAGLGGEFHIFGYGFAPLTLSAEDDLGNITETPSNRTHQAETPGGVPAASLELTQGRGNYLITAKGRGCAAVITFKRVY